MHKSTILTGAHENRLAAKASTQTQTGANIELMTLSISTKHHFTARSGKADEGKGFGKGKVKC